MVYKTKYTFQQNLIFSSFGDNILQLKLVNNNVVIFKFLVNIFVYLTTKGFALIFLFINKHSLKF